jgi:hypothetical protein
VAPPVPLPAQLEARLVAADVESRTEEAGGDVVDADGAGSDGRQQALSALEHAAQARTPSRRGRGR